MREDCLTEGTIQAFLDGELDAAARDGVSRHLALCDDCLLCLSDAEEEVSVAFAALEQEFDTLVPTHRLWTKINATLEEEKRSRSVWQRVLAGVSNLGLSAPSVAAFASLVIVGGLFAVLYVSRPLPGVPGVPAVDAVPGALEIAQSRLPVAAAPAVGQADEDTPAVVVSGEEENTGQTVRQPESVRRQSPAGYVINARYEPKTEARQPKSPARPREFVTPVYLPGEDSYVKTIATLKDTVDTQKDFTLTPSERFAFEKDMAVINDAIDKMKQEVKTNPDNKTARRLLLASYQNKVDLLNSVSQKSELMASLRD